MAQGCYRPEAAAEFWLRMERLGQGAPPKVLSTHPSNHDRFEQIKNWLPQAHEKQEMSDCRNLSGYGMANQTRGRGRWLTESAVDQFSSAFGRQMPVVVRW